MKMYKRIAAFLMAAAMTIAALPMFSMPEVYAESTVENAAEHYFYDQLKPEAQVFYRAMEKMEKDGVFIRGESFDLVANKFLTSQEAEAYGSLKLMMQYGAARDAFCADRADLFYVDFSYLSIRVNTDESGHYHVYLGTGRSDSYYTEGLKTEEDVRTAIEAYNTAVNKVVEEARKVTAEEGENLDAEKVKYVHDYITHNTSYRLENVCKPENIGYIRTAYGSLVKRQAVCEGYSRALKAVLDRLGIPCVLVYGVYMHGKDIPEKHMWCEVQIDGAWYAVDATMDDPYDSKKTTDGIDGYESQDYLLAGSTRMDKQHYANGNMSEVEFEFEYPPLRVDGYNVEVIGSYGGLTVKYKPDGEMDGIKGGVYYVSYEGMGPAKMKEKGKYLLAKMTGYNTEKGKYTGSWFYVTTDGLFGAIVDLGTEVVLPAPHITYVEFAVTDVPGRPYSPDDPYYTNFKGDTTAFSAYSGVIYNPHGSYVKPPYPKSTTPVLTSTIDAEEDYHVVFEYDEVLKLEKEGTEPDVIMTAENALRYDVQIPSTAADYASVSNFEWDGKSKVEFDFSPSRMWLDDSTRYIFDITGLVGEYSEKPPLSVDYYATFPKCCPCAYWSVGIDWTLYAKPTLMEDFSPDNFDPTGWKDEEGKEIAKELASRMVLVVSTPSDKQYKEIEKELENSEAGKGAEILQTFNINLTTCKAQVVKTGQKVKIFLGFPEGYIPGTEKMKNSTFKAYHFFKDDDGKITGCEEIECTVTNRGLIIMCNSFSPFAIAKVPVEEDAPKTVVCNVPDGGAATFDGSNNSSSIFFLEKDKSKTITITANKGFVIDSIKVGENYVKLDEKDIYKKEIEVSYDDFGIYDGMIDVKFVAETVYQEEAERGEVPADTDPVAAAGVKVRLTFGDDVAVENGVNVRYVEAEDIGSSLTFAPTVETDADSGIEYSYQWYKNGEPISGETGAKLTISDVSVSDYGTYELVVSFEVGGEALQRKVSVVLKAAEDKDSGNNSGNDNNTSGTQQPSTPSTPDNTDSSSNLLEDKTTGIELTGTFAEGVQLKVTADDVSSGDTRIVYDITLLDADNRIVQPDGKVTVKIPVPEKWIAEKLYVYRAEADGTYTDMNAVLENGCMVFVTNHFSKYVLTTEKLEVGTYGTDSSKSDTDPDPNHNTGVALVIVPVLVSAAAAVLTVKRRR